MIKQHTAQSLAKYLGNKFQFTREYKTYIGFRLISINERGLASFNAAINDSIFFYLDNQVYPILKTYDRLLDVNPETGNRFVKDIFDSNADKIWTRSFNKKGSKYNDVRKKQLFEVKGILVYPGLLTDNFVFMTGYSDEDYNFSGHDADPPKKWLKIPELEKLIQYGFGAIENKNSPTGYVDLFGYPCVKE